VCIFLRAQIAIALFAACLPLLLVFIIFFI